MLRQRIIEKLEYALKPLAYIHALWLEGADANGTVDEYSDIDIWVDFDDEFEAAAIQVSENALNEIAEFDYKYVMNHDHPKIRQRIYHLRGTPEFLTLDFCWQLHSRGDGVLIKGDAIEAARVIFDKSGVVRYADYDPDVFAGLNKARLEEAKYRYSQHSRVFKYVLRGQYAESYAYYSKYVVEPLVDLLRLIFTPAHADYYLVHISQHIPREELEKLEYFLKISTVEDIAARTREAEVWFAELLGRV